MFCFKAYRQQAFQSLFSRFCCSTNSTCGKVYASSCTHVWGLWMKLFFQIGENGIFSHGFRPPFNRRDCLFFVLWRRSTIIQYSFNDTIFMQIFMGIRPPTEIKFCFPSWVCFYISLAASTILGRKRDNKSGNSVLVVTYTHSFLHASFPF